MIFIKKIFVFLTCALLSAACLCPALAGDYFSVHGHDYDWTHNLSCFHSERFTYLYGEHLYMTENGYLYQPAFTRLQLTVRDRDGNALKDGTAIKTGDVLTEQRDGTPVALTTFVYAGDVAADGRIDADDARKTLRAAIGLAALSDAEKEAADLDNDGTLTPADARTILRKSVHLKTDEEQEGGFWDDYIYRTTLLVRVTAEDGKAALDALRAAHTEVTEARILAEESGDAGTPAVYVLLYVNSYEAKTALAEAISGSHDSVDVNLYSLC